jgi:hypothetical protein
MLEARSREQAMSGIHITTQDELPSPDYLSIHTQRSAANNVRSYCNAGITLMHCQDYNLKRVAQAARSQTRRIVATILEIDCGQDFMNQSKR